MRLLDRYLARQLIPVWVWCVLVFLLLSCTIDLFGRLDEILHYHIPASVVLQYYANFLPYLFVQTCPLAVLLAAAFVSTRLMRHQELLAMSAGGVSRLRAVVPLLFIGWLIALAVFTVNERVVPASSAAYERLRIELFKGGSNKEIVESVAIMDQTNRIYHARLFDRKQQELTDLTILEHDAANLPKRTIYARRAIYTAHGWLLLYGTITRLGPRGMLVGEPEPFVERLFPASVTPKSFEEPAGRPELLRTSQLRQLITQLRSLGIRNVRRYRVELASKLAFPFMNVVVCLIAFTGSTRRHVRGHLVGLGKSLALGMGYYIAVAIGLGIGKEGLLPVWLAVWLPHVVAIAACVKLLRTA